MENLVLAAAIGSFVASAPGLRKVYAQLWRPYIAVPVALILGRSAYDQWIMPMNFGILWVAPAWNLSTDEFQSLLPALQRFTPLQSASAAQTVFTAFELGAWELSRGRDLSTAEFAQVRNISFNGARVVLEVLGELGLLRKGSAGFRHDWSDAALKRVQTCVNFVCTVELPLVAHLTEAVRTGTAVGLHKAFGSKYKSLYHARTEVPSLVAWTDMMNSVSSLGVDILLGRRDALFSGAKFLLDFCGNEGQNAMTFVRRYPNLHVTIHDLPAVINDPERGTAARIRQAGLETRISTFAWDLTDPRPVEPPRGDYDVITLLNCVNEWRREELDRNLRALYRSLRPGGTLLVLGSFASRVRDLSTPHYSVWLAAPYFVAATQDGGKMYDYEEIEEAGVAAGYVEVTTAVWEMELAIFMKKPGP